MASITVRVEPPAEETLEPLTLAVAGTCTVADVKQKISQHYPKFTPDEQLLYLRKADESVSEVLLQDDALLASAGVGDEAVVRLKRKVLNWEFAKGTKTESVARRGRLSYYHTDRAGDTVPEELRVASGGEPVRLESETREVDRAVRIKEFTWADDGASVKVFIDVDQETRAVVGAGDGKQDRLRLEFPEAYAFRLVICEPEEDDGFGLSGGKTYVLDVSHLFKEILPDKCKVRVSQGKRITVTLKKLDANTRWFTLCKVR
mmetsp:Transcript_59219/g.152355  ORF Transcript_59219/g.152355 Transcript_59219/m.152355 type:complete len:261 (-) Transcript_59219:251-1033(-)